MRTEYKDMIVTAEPEEEVYIHDAKAAVRVSFADVDILVAILHAVSNMRKLEIDLKNKLYAYGPYVLTNNGGNTYRIVGYAHMQTYTDAVYEDLSPIGDYLNTEFSLRSFPPDPETENEPLLTFDELHPPRPTGYEGRSF